MKASELDLIEPALSGALALEAKHPTISFTSGRRTRLSQAHAMATNVALNRKWIEQTYRDTPETRACQTWVDTHPEASDVEAFFNGFLSVLNGFSDAELAEWNHHLAGLAFDVQPQVHDAGAIKADIRALPHLNLFLEVEGGLTRWHAAFDPLPAAA